MPGTASPTRPDGKPFSAFDVEPDADEVEVTLLGPGYGECVLVHVAAKAWLIVDSCEHDARATLPALDYLTAIGVDHDDVRWIVATHWHDDHVRRIDELAAACPNARISVSGALENDELLGGLLAVKPSPNLKVTNGVHAMQRLFRTYRSTGRLELNGESSDLPLVLPAGLNALVRVLSPTSATRIEAWESIGQLLEKALNGEAAQVPKPSRNDAAVVLWLEIGRQPPNTNLDPDDPDGPVDVVAILLGADLETRGDPLTGWKGVVGGPYRRPVKATAVKVPHHGSANGYHEPVWRKMTAAPIAFLTPWDRNKGLPTDEGLAKISPHTSSLLSTALVPAVRKRIAGKDRQTRAPARGRITLRCVVPALGTPHSRDDWRVDLKPPAHHLTPTR